MQRKNFIAALAAVAGLPTLGADASAAEADLILTGATIHTVDPHFTNAEAFAVRQGRFVRVGSLSDVMALRGPHTRILNAAGKTVIPGLIDAHLHLMQVGLALHEVDVYHLSTFEEVVARTRAFANASLDAWIVGDGWDQNLWPGKAFPTHDALSAAIPDRPVLLSRVDGHALLANAKAMQRAGITADTATPAGGRILRAADGTPTGVFIDNAMSLIYRAVPAPTHEQLVRAARAAVRECNRWGLTAVADPGAGFANIAVYEELARAKHLDLRTYVMLADDPAVLDRYLNAGPRSGAYNDHLWIRSVKMFIDGALGSRGAALLAPYSDDPQNVGLLRTSQAHIQDLTERALSHGFQACVHAIGDRGNRVVLDAFEAALHNRPRGDYRLRIEHAQILSPQDIPRFKQLGVTPSMQTTHQISDMGWAERRLGAQRIRGGYAWRSLLDTGVTIPNGTDAPVESVNTLRTFHSAIARQNEANEPPDGWYPDQRMSREEALQSMTIWAAHANFQDHVIGSITPGKRADFVMLDRDWMTVPASEIMHTRVLETYLSGRNVYDAASHVAASPFRPRRGRNCCGA